VVWLIISIAVSTTIIGLLYFSPYLSNILHLQRQQAKVVPNVVFIMVYCSLKIESLRSFRKQKCVGLPPPKPFADAFGKGVPSLNHPHGPLPVSQSVDLPLVIVIMYFQIKGWKRFIGDILHIVILDFSADILTLSVKIWCPGLVQENYGQIEPESSLSALGIELRPPEHMSEHVSERLTS